MVPPVVYTCSLFRLLTHNLRGVGNLTNTVQKVPLGILPTKTQPIQIDQDNRHAIVPPSKTHSLPENAQCVKLKKGKG